MKRYGFIRTKDDIKFLILYSLAFVKFPINSNNVVDICTWCDDGFDYFEFNEAFLELLESEHLSKELINSEDMFSITQKGIDTSKAFEAKLPQSVKERANVSALRVTKAVRRDACIETSTKKCDENDFIVSMKMQDVFSLDFAVVSHEQGTMLETHFKKHAEKIYDAILDSLTNDFSE